MRHILCLVAALALLPLAAFPRDVAGRFDYYVLALSWSPTWCSSIGEPRAADQCATGKRLDFVVHGLWPQYERGWPQNCVSNERDPSRRESQRMADVMGSGGLAWHQWQKHGRCAGLSAAGYYAATRDAAERIAIPGVFADLRRDITLPPSVIEDAFIAANPGLGRDGITIICRAGNLQEVRICLTPDLQLRDCAPDTRRDCPRSRILMEEPR